MNKQQELTQAFLQPQTSRCLHLVLIKDDSALLTPGVRHAIVGSYTISGPASASQGNTSLYHRPSSGKVPVKAGSLSSPPGYTRRMRQTRSFPVLPRDLQFASCLPPRRRYKAVCILLPNTVNV